MFQKARIQVLEKRVQELQRDLEVFYPFNRAIIAALRDLGFTYVPARKESDRFVRVKENG